MNKRMHTRENVEAAKRNKMKQRKHSDQTRESPKSAFTLKQTHTLEEEVQETTATERQDRQNRFRITKTLCTSHFNKHKSSLQIQNLEIHLK